MQTQTGKSVADGFQLYTTLVATVVLSIATCSAGINAARQFPMQLALLTYCSLGLLLVNASGAILQWYRDPGDARGRITRLEQACTHALSMFLAFMVILDLVKRPDLLTAASRALPGWSELRSDISRYAASFFF
jgi:hypothetical protein